MEKRWPRHGRRDRCDGEQRAGTVVSGRALRPRKVDVMSRDFYLYKWLSSDVQLAAMEDPGFFMIHLMVASQFYNTFSMGRSTYD